jgi:hypothetical protein
MPWTVGVSAAIRIVLWYTHTHGGGYIYILYHLLNGTVALGTNFSSLDHGMGFARHDDDDDDDDARATVFGTILQCPCTCTDTRLPFYHVTAQCGWP